VLAGLAVTSHNISYLSTVTFGLQISRAQFFTDVYTTGTANNVSGFIFWNLGCTLGPAHYEVSPDTPAAWQVIEQYGPAKSATTETQQTCPL
jgi:hypothetical protein